MIDMQQFGQRLAAYRQAQRLTQMALARRADVPQPLISDLEAGKRTGVTLEIAWRLARTLAVRLDDLVGMPRDTGATPLPESSPSGPPNPTAHRRGRPRKRSEQAPNVSQPSSNALQR